MKTEFTDVMEARNWLFVKALLNAIVDFHCGGRFPWGMRQSSTEAKLRGVSACTLIPQESPPEMKVNKQKLRKSTTNDNGAFVKKNDITVILLKSYVFFRHIW